VTLRRVEVEFAARWGALLTGTGAAAAAVRQFGREVSQASVAHAQLSRDMGRTALAAGTVLGGALALAAKQSIALEAELRNVATISDQVRDNFGATRDVLVGLSKELPQSSVELARGLYDIASAGFQGAAGVEVLRQSAIGASAGLSTTAAAGRALTAILNAYGLSAAHAADVNDVLFQTVNLGVVTFDELAGTIGDVAGIAALAGVSIGEVGSAIATMTRVGLSGAESVTSLNRLLTSIIDPSEALVARMRELGLSLESLRDPAIGLGGFMERIRQSTGGSVVEMQKLFPEIRSLRGALALASAGGQNYATVAAQVADETARAGAAQKALREQSKSLSFQLKIARNDIAAIGTSAGQVLIPVLRAATGFVIGMTRAFDSLPGPVKSLMTILAGLAAVTLLASGAFGLLYPRIAAARAQFQAMIAQGATLTGVLAGVQLAAGGIFGVLGLVVGLTAIFSSQQKRAADHTLELVDALKQEAQGVRDAANQPLIKALVEEGVLENTRKLGLAVEDVVGALRGAPDAVARLNAGLDKLGQSGEMTQEQYRAFEKVFGSLDQAAANIPDWSGDTAKWGHNVEELGGRFGDLRDQFRDARQQTEDYDAAQAALASTTRNVGEQTRELTETQKRLGDAFADFLDPARAYDDALRRIDESQQQLRSGADVYTDLVRSAQDALNKVAAEQARVVNQAASDQAAAWNRAHRGAIERQHAARKTADDFRQTATVGLETYARALRDQVNKQRQWEADLLVITRRAGPAVAQTLREMGDEGASLVHQLAGKVDSNVRSIDDSLKRLAPQARVSLAAWMAELEGQLQAQARFWSNLQQLASRGFVDVAVALAELGPKYAQAAEEAAKAPDVVVRRLSKDLASQKRQQEITGDIREMGLKALAAISREASISVDELMKQVGAQSEEDLRIILAQVQQMLDTLPPEKVVHIRFLFDADGYVPSPADLRRIEERAAENVRDVRVPGGTIPAFADGGMWPARTPGWYRFAEAETGGESLIPHSAAKRHRAMPVLARTAAMFGYGLSPMLGQERASAGGHVAPIVVPVSKTTTQTVTVERLEARDPHEFERWAEQKSRVRAMAGEE
jgi:TP901 family phage tail tape measure protein